MKVSKIGIESALDLNSKQLYIFGVEVLNYHNVFASIPLCGWKLSRQVDVDIRGEHRGVLIRVGA